MQSSSIRGKVAFVPWFAALVLGASAHAGWLLHELRHDHNHNAGERGPVVMVDIECDSSPSVEARIARHERILRQRVSRRASARRVKRPRCQVEGGLESASAADDLDDWIERRSSYSYTIDRRALDHVIPNALLTVGHAEVNAIAEAIALGRPLTLRNIRPGTPLWALGLRNRDRVVRLRTEGDASIERVSLEVERRGRVLELDYDLI